MPTIASACVIGHLYREPSSGDMKDGKKWARFNLWTSDKIKPQGGGDYEKKFSSWSGICNGPQAEWLIRDGKKGSLIAVTGTIRIDSHADKDGKIHSSGEFVRVQEIRVLDRDDAEDAKPVGTAAQAGPKKPTPTPTPTPADNSEEPPF